GATFGRIDGLVNNAGVCEIGRFDELPVEAWNRTIAINLTGAFLCARAAVPYLSRGGGAIVNIASTAGLRGHALHIAYCASKFGLIGMTQSLAAELGSHGIRVNAVCPGALVHTAMGQSVWPAVARETDRSVDEVLGQLTDDIPMGRFTEEDDVVAAIMF